MSAETESRPRRAKARQPQPAHPVIVPSGADAVLSPQQIAALLDVSRAMFFKMVAAREYPAADLRITGRLPRWSVELHNRWVRERRKANGGVGLQEET